jgi:GH15 family glucan-1,4-alpha-glucosidase
MYDACDPRITATLEAMRERLWLKTQVGGLARHENDTYHQVSKDLANVPGNPWFICTAWLAQWYIARAENMAELAPAREVLEWICQRALPSGVLAEQVHPYDDAPLSVSPLTWSHAEFSTAVLEYVDKAAEFNRCTACGMPVNPRQRHEHQPREFMSRIAAAQPA